MIKKTVFCADDKNYRPMNKTVRKTSGVFFKDLMVIHASLNTGVLILAAFFYYFSMESGAEEGEIPGWWSTVAIVVAFAGVFFSAYTYKSNSLALRSNDNLSEKLVAYRKASIASWIILDVAIIVNLAIYFINQNELLLYIALFLVALMFLKRPSKGRAIDSLDLGKKEREKIEDPDAVVVEL